MTKDEMLAIHDKCHTIKHSYELDNIRVVALAYQVMESFTLKERDSSWDYVRCCGWNKGTVKRMLESVDKEYLDTHPRLVEFYELRKGECYEQIRTQDDR